MDLVKIAEIKSGMEDMMEKIYSLQEAIIEKDPKIIAIKKELFKAGTRELNLLLIRSTCYDNTALIKKGEGLTLLPTLVSGCSGVSEKELNENPKHRKRILVLPRQVHMVLAHKTFGLSLSEAGKIYEKDHATVIHAAKTVRNLWQTDKDFRKSYASIFDYCIQFDSELKRTTTIDYLNDK